MIKEESAVRLDKKWVVQIERWALLGPFLVTLTLLLGLKDPLQPFWIFSICYGVSYLATFIMGWKGALLGAALSSAFLFGEMSNWNLWHIALFSSANLALFIMGLCRDALHKTLFQYHNERQSLITHNEQLVQDQGLDKARYKEVARSQKEELELLTKEIEELKGEKFSLLEEMRVQAQNLHLITSDKDSVAEQVFIEQRDNHKLQGVIDQLKAQLARYEDMARRESKEEELLNEINKLRVEKFELSVLESSHLGEKLRMEKKLRDLEQHCENLVGEMSAMEKNSNANLAQRAPDEIAIAYTHLRNQFEEKKNQLLEHRKEYFMLEGQADALLKYKELEEWNKEHQLFSIISIQNELLKELEEKEKEIESLENLLTAGLEGKKDRPRLPQMKKLQVRAKRKKEEIKSESTPHDHSQ